MVDYSGHLGRYGEGSYVQRTPQQGITHFHSFAGGYFSAVNRKDVPENSSPFAIDFETTYGDRLRRSPGTTLLESFDTRTPDKFVVHGSLDFTSELVFFDPPYLGVKRLGDTVWADKGLAEDGWWAWANFGGTLIFSDGDAVYARQVNEGTTITPIPEAPVAVTYESWAARMWAGGAIIDENFEQLGLVWSAANSDYTDWTGEGSGFELLLDAISAGDRIIRLKAMNLDSMAVLLRNSIWLVRRTAKADRPGDPQPRVAGKGAVNHDVVQSTEKGIIFLSDNGVEVFDGNTCLHISDAIDNELVPLDYGAILEYSSSYDTIRNRYYLHDPRGTTWIFDLNRGRWYRRSLNAIASVMWPRQAEDAIVEGTPRMIFLGDQMNESIAPRAIAVEDQDSFEYFGVPMTPIWTTKPIAKPNINELLTTKLFNLEYVGAADIEIWAIDNHGNYELLVVDQLIPQTELEVVALYASKVGRLSAIMVRLTDGDIEISDLQAVTQDRGPRLAIGEGGIIGNFPDRTTLLDFPTGQDWPEQEGPMGPGGAPENWPIIIIFFGFFTFTFAGDPEEVPEEVTEFYWDFGDGETETTIEPSVEHTFSGPGNYSGFVEFRINGWTFAQYPWINVVTEDDAEGPIPPEATIAFIDAWDLSGQSNNQYQDECGGWSAMFVCSPAAGQAIVVTGGYMRGSTWNVGAEPPLPLTWEGQLNRGLVRFLLNNFNNIPGGLSLQVTVPAWSVLDVPGSFFPDDTREGWSTGTLDPRQGSFSGSLGLYVTSIGRTEDPTSADYNASGADTILASNTLYPVAAMSLDEFVLEFPLNLAGLSSVQINGAYTTFLLRYTAELAGEPLIHSVNDRTYLGVASVYVENAHPSEEEFFFGTGGVGTFECSPNPGFTPDELIGARAIVARLDPEAFFETTITDNTDDTVMFPENATSYDIIIITLPPGEPTIPLLHVP